MFKKGLKWSAIAILATVSTSVIGLVSLIIINQFQIIWTNNQNLKHHKVEFKKIQHPANSSIVSSSQGVFSPPGSGKHCFYFVGQLRQTTGSIPMVETFYANQQQRLHVEPFHNGTFGKSTGAVEIVPYGFHQPERWGIDLDDIEDPDNLYVIYRLDYTINDRLALDLRCN